MEMPSQAILIHAAAIPESIVAPTLFRPEFLHSLGHNRKSANVVGMSAFGGKADLIRREADIAAGSPAPAGHFPVPPDEGEQATTRPLRHPSTRVRP